MSETVHAMVDESPEGATEMWRWIRYQFGGVVRLLTRSDKFFVAAVNGPAAGVGSPSRCRATWWWRRRVRAC